MKSNDMVKYLTQEFVKYIDTPKTERKKRPKERWSSRWFGMIPMAIRMFIQRMRETRKGR
ncbi:YqzE family protein [Ammoniphilus sp. 3BR4]|uniref:YqzE family protein n=1 Tax=Ammoniphilus sp. 3BR4 TaxID=3158265 RepID=UPI0034658C32